MSNTSHAWDTFAFVFHPCHLKRKNVRYGRDMRKGKSNTFSQNNESIHALNSNSIFEYNKYLYSWFVL